jgi:hypothetical protein
MTLVWSVRGDGRPVEAARRPPHDALRPRTPPITIR